MLSHPSSARRCLFRPLRQNSAARLCTRPLVCERVTWKEQRRLVGSQQLSSNTQTVSAAGSHHGESPNGVALVVRLCWFDEVAEQHFSSKRRRGHRGGLSPEEDRAVSVVFVRFGRAWYSVLNTQRSSNVAKFTIRSFSHRSSCEGHAQVYAVT